MRSLLFLVLATFAVPAVFAQENNKDANHCAVYPITVASELLAGKVNGTLLTNVPLGTGYGNYNWLSWQGNAGVNSLTGSLRIPGNSDQYQNPHNDDDHVLSQGDWVSGLPGVKNSKPVRDALDDLLSREIVVPVFGEVDGTGKLKQFLITGFAKVSLTDYQLGGKGVLSFVYRGMEQCNNVPPVAKPQNYSLPEDSSLSFTLEASDATHDTLDFELVTPPQNGVLRGTPPDLTYIPRPNFNGNDQITFLAKDATSSSDPVDIVFTVSPVNDLPIVSGTELEAMEDSRLDVAINASDVDGDPLAFSVVSEPENGELTLVGGGIVFLPDADFNGQTSFSISVSDGIGEVLVGYTVTVQAVNDPPVLEGQLLSVNEDGVLQTELNAIDPDGDALAFEVTSPPEHGSLFLQGSSLTYTPDENFYGSDAFTVSASDGVDVTHGEFPVQVASVNDVPKADNISLNLFVGETVIRMLNASDSDGQLIEFTLLDDTSLGSMELNGESLSFTASAPGEESVRYRVVDDQGAYADASINLLIEKNNISPSISSEPEAKGNEGEVYRYLVTAEDPDGDAIQWRLEQSPVGMVIHADSGEITWHQPTSGLYDIRVIADDGNGGQDFQNFTLLITKAFVDAAAGNLHWFMFNTNNNGARDLYVTISTDDSASYEVSVPALDFYASGIASPGKAEVVDLSELAESLTSDYSGVSDFGVKVVSSQPARVNAYNLAGMSSDSLHVYPVSSWGMEYLLATFPGGAGALYGVVAGQDGTTVTITSADGSIEEIFSLDEGQAYQSIIEGNKDPSGFLVKANKPVAVFAGNKCTSVYRAACDHLVEQMRPISHLGSEHVLIPFATREGGDYLRVYGAFDSTLVYLNGVLVAEINEGDVFSEIVDQPTVITSSRPVTAIQYAIGTNYDPTYNSDPLMLLLQPIGLNEPSRSHNYYYPSLSGFGGDITHHMTLLKKTAESGPLSLNGSLLSDAGWNAIEGTDYSFYRQQVDPGYHHVNTGFNFSSYSYAHAYFTSYGHAQNGVDGRFISPQNIFIDHSGPVEIGQEQCLNIYLVNAVYEPAPFSHVQVSIENDYSRRHQTALTDAGGKATVCYRTGTPGTDDITVNSSGVQAKTRVIWLPLDNEASINYDPVITSLPSIATVNSGDSYQYQVVAHDPNQDALHYSLFSYPYGMSIEPQTGLVSWQVPSTIDDNLVVLVVEDGMGGSAEQSFRIGAGEVNFDPEIVSSPPLVAKEGHEYRYRVEYEDRDGFQAHGVWIEEGPEGAGTFNNQTTNLVLWTPTFEDVGLSHHFKILVDDGNGGVDYQEFDVTVEANQLPVFSSAPITTATTQHLYVYTPIVTDPDEEDFAFLKLGVAPPGMSMTNRKISWKPTDEQVGAVPVEVIAYDEAGGENVQAFVIDVKPNAVPEIVLSEQVPLAITGHAYRSRIQLSDADGDFINTRLVAGPDGMNVYPTWISWAPQLDQTGTYEVIWEAYDNFGGVTRESFELNVIENRLPEFTNTPQPSVSANHTFRYTPELFDPDGDSVRFTLVSAPAGMKLGYGSVFWSVTAGDIGSHSFVLEADDGHGGTISRTFLLNVQEDAAPQITSTPPPVAYIGDAYQYVIQAQDPEGDSISYQVVDGPDAVIYQGNILVWRPSESDLGDRYFRIAAQDIHGKVGYQSFAVRVRDPNEPEEPDNALPVITSEPSRFAKAEQHYRSDILASDADGDALHYSLISAPDGMDIGTLSGELDWIPSASQLGDHEVTVKVSDGRGGVVAGTYRIQVVSADVELKGELSLSGRYLSPGDTLSFQANVDGATGELSYSATLDGEPVAISSVGAGEVPVNDIGVHTLSVRLTDQLGELVLTETFTVKDPADTEAPELSLAAPANHATITSPTDVIGSVSDANLLHWQLSYQRQSNKANPTVIASGSTEQLDAVLGRFDPSMLKNGLYRLVLEATDLNGQVGSTSRIMEVTGNLKVGHFSFTVEDLNVPVSGIPITVTRTYDTRARSERTSLGYGWTFDYQDVELNESRVPGLYWSQNEYPTGPLGALTNYCIEPMGRPSVSVTLPSGQIERFDVYVKNSCSLTGGHDVQLAFRAKDGTLSTLEQNNYGNLRLVGSNLVDILNGASLADPSAYTLTTQGGMIYTLSESLGITRIQEPNGNTLTYSDSGIVHSSGKAVRFVRDGSGVITGLEDPAGNVITYQYSDEGDLISTTDALGNATSYRYLMGEKSHFMSSISDPLDRDLIRNLYDDSGRLIAQEDSEGNRTDFNHDLEGRLSVITDRRGNTTQLRYDDRGNVLNQVDAMGGVTAYSYDAYDNQLTMTNPLGETSVATFDDRKNQLTQTDALGNTTAYTYNPRGQELTITDARGNIYKNSYDAVGNLLTVTDPDGNVAGNHIDIDGNVTQTTDMLGNTTEYSYDGDGNKLTETDAEGNVTTYSYDANGNVLTESVTRQVNGQAVTETTTYEYDATDRVVATHYPDGSTVRTEYDVVGNEVAMIDAKGRRTEKVYDAYGRVTAIHYPDATVERKAYDAEGNLVRETDRLGRVSTYTYDALNRQVGINYPDGSTSQTEYDAAGRVVAEINERGERTEYEYDAAGRRTAVIDALGNRHTFEYDADGNRIREIDANGHVTEYEYNALGQKTLTRFDDGHTVIDEVDVMGRRTAQVDQAGTRTEYGYDGLGRLTEVRQFLDGDTLTTAYSYDSQGNKLTQTDAEGRTTRWTYDSMGRVLTRTLPMGQVETFAYDANGNPISHTDFKGQVTTSDYDSQNRLIRQTYADGTEESWVYDSASQNVEAQQVVDGNVSVTRYDYDDRGRLVRETKPNGAVLEYGYDAAGNRTRLTTTQANGDSRTVTYTFDALNRLSTVSDDTGTTTYGYDAAGNRASLTRPNGVQTTYTYDGVNRLTKQIIKDQAGNILASYTYSLSPTGRRTGIEEHNGRVTEYSHDGLYRLIGERVTDPVNPDYTATFEYDKVGNRTYSTIDGVQTAYTYDDNDRLTQAGGITYTYDANGNTLTETEDGSITTYTYDARNKLISREDASVLARYGYDIHGIRNSKTENGVVTNYVVDHNRQYAQVLAESSNGATSKQYTYGDDLLSQQAANDSHFYLYDGLGSTRALTDSSGAVTDRYDYEAFGELLNRVGETDNSYLYTGEQYDPNMGQYYLRARYYNQGVGRFTQMDEWMGNNNDPITLHKYLYANADPVNGTDPTGKFTLASVSAANNVASVLMDMQIQAGFSLLDGAITMMPGGDGTQAQVRDMQKLVAIVQMGAGGVQLLRLLSGKFRKLCNSFDGDTLVHTANGLKKIKNIKIGEKVWAYNEETDEVSLQEVVHLIQSEGEKQIVDVTLDSGEVIQATANHPFFVPESEEQWIDAEGLDRTMWLLGLNGDMVGLEGLVGHTEHQPVFNLSVAEDHTFFVGEAGVLVHNTSVCEPWRILWGKRSSHFPKRLSSGDALGRPKPSDGSAHAHHIVPIEMEAARDLQKQLAEAGIEGNSIYNGVWLDKIAHRKKHSSGYIAHLEMRLDGVRGKSAIMMELRDVAKDLISGKIRVDM